MRGYWSSRGRCSGMSGGCEGHGNKARGSTRRTSPIAAGPHGHSTEAVCRRLGMGCDPLALIARARPRRRSPGVVRSCFHFPGCLPVPRQQCRVLSVPESIRFSASVSLGPGRAPAGWCPRRTRQARPVRCSATVRAAVRAHQQARATQLARVDRSTSRPRGRKSGFADTRQMISVFADVTWASSASVATRRKVASLVRASVRMIVPSGRTTSISPGGRTDVSPRGISRAKSTWVNVGTMAPAN